MNQQPKLVNLDASPDALEALSVEALQVAASGDGRGAFAARRALAAFNEHAENGNKGRGIDAARVSLKAALK